MEPVLARRAGHAARRQAKRGGGLVWAMDLTAAGIVLGGDVACGAAAAPFWRLFARRQAGDLAQGSSAVLI